MKKFYRYFTTLTFILCMLVANAQQAVKLIDTGKSVIISNEYVQVTINKRKAYISSMKYHGLELIGKQHLNWNIVGTDANKKVIRRFPQKSIYTIRINPDKNNGERAEVSFLFKYAGDTKTFPLDIDLRFSLGKKDKGVYLEALFSHKPGYPAFHIGQGRMIVELNPEVFDFYTVDANRRREMASGYDVKHGLRRNVKEAVLLTTGIRKGKVEHKYDYAAMLSQTPTWGWTSTKDHIGTWMINPSTEYLNGGPTQVGITGHVECILLNHWHDGHYGGKAIVLSQKESWVKYIGPIFLYCNTGKSSDEMWKDAINEAGYQKSLWPFNWINDKEYPAKNERGILKGQIIVKDTLYPHPHYTYKNMWVGLAFDSGKANSNWQYESKHYQFWVKADNDGYFTIPNIRAGKYSLYAFADGIFGEFKKPDIFIKKGSKINFGKIIWTPVRYGKQIWEIGIPNRSAEEFRHGDHYWQWGLYMKYPKEFPNDVNYIVGKSNWKKDWNYCQPTVIDSNYKVVRGTKWTIQFDMPKKENGQAMLRIGVCGSRNGEVVKIAVNGTPIGDTGHLPHMGVMHRDGIRGKEVEVDLPFDANLLNKGTNKITLSLNARNWTFGVLYDYLRLEINQKK